MIIVTLIAAERLSQQHIWDAADAIDEIGFQSSGGALEDAQALDLKISEPCDHFGDLPDNLDGRNRWITGISSTLDDALPTVDFFVQPEEHRAKRLLVADMDSTMITVECIDELADYAGQKAEVAAITEAAMRGELDFEAALDARVRLLAGMPTETIDRCRKERVRITPGARTLVQTMKARGATCILVSGGFTRFAGPVAEAIGFDRVVANVLEIADGKLTGEARRPIVGAETKRQVLIGAAAELGIAIEQTLAVGDGANDIPMLQAAGLGVAYHAKPAARAAADAAIDHNDLTALLYAQGIPRAQWVVD